MLDPNAGFSRIAYWTHRAAFGCLLLLTVLAPWCFGSWEMHWFWLSAGVLFLAALLAGAGSLLDAFAGVGSEEVQFPAPRFRCEPRLVFLAASTTPFLAYLLWRMARPSAPGCPAVAMTAQRCALLFATVPLLVATLFLVLNRRRTRLLATVFYANSVLLACNALWSYFTSGGNRILWVDSPFQYSTISRASWPLTNAPCRRLIVESPGL